MKQKTENDEFLFTLSRNLMRARESIQMKQDVAAKELKISRSTLSKYENGDLHSLTFELLLTMCNLYQKTLLEILPDKAGITFIFNPTEGAQYNNNQQAYNMQTHSDIFSREMIKHLQEEIVFLRKEIIEKNHIRD